MNGDQLLKERTSRNWEQLETAKKLKLSQPYLSLIEAGKRPVTEKLARRAVRLFDLPPTALPVEEPKTFTRLKTGDQIASQLAALGYPKFSHLKKSTKVNPSSVLLAALKTDELESRTVEALPWLIFNFPEMSWAQIIRTAKIYDAQNRLGFLLSLVCEKAETTDDENKTNLFKELLSNLEQSRLLREDTFRQKSLTEAEKKWLKQNCSKKAKFWRVLSNLSSEHLTF